MIRIISDIEITTFGLKTALRYEMAFRVVLDVRLKYGSCTAAAVLDEMHF